MYIYVYHDGAAEGGVEGMHPPLQLAAAHEVEQQRL